MVPNNDTIAKLMQCNLMGVDIETKDPKLVSHGTGVYRGDGYVVGVAFAGDNGANCYIPLRHPDVSEKVSKHNSAVIDLLLKSAITKVYANGLYDLDWLINGEGREVNGGFEDIQLAEPLLDEYARSYSLDTLSKKYLGQTKKSDVLEQYADQMGWKGKAIAHLWQMPSSVAAEYASFDALAPVKIIQLQHHELERQGLMELYRIECRNVPLLLQMRKQGVRIDVKKYMSTIEYITESKYNVEQRIFKWAEDEINIGSTSQLAKVLDRKGIIYPRNPPTEKMKAAGKPGNANLDKMSLLKLAEHDPLFNDILNWRKYNTTINLFLQPYAELKVKDRLHCNFHPLRSDNYGTVSGRFSASKPNLQQVSAKEFDDDGDGEWSGPIIRELFIPEEGCKWAKADYSQVEYRIGAHYALGRGAQEIRDAYNNDPNIDYHAMMQERTGFSRRDTKRVNFGGAYGIGALSATKLFGWSFDEATEILRQFHAAAPFIKTTRDKVMHTAQNRGYIHTILGRRARVHPSRKVFSMYNRLIQGSAADIMKKGMVDCYEAGLYHVLIPHLTVHDEIDVSVPATKEAEEALQEQSRLMEEAVKLSVPLKVDCHTGANWAEAD